MYSKFLKIPHHPLSESISSDDNWLTDMSHFEKINEIVVLEKVDAENTTMYSDKIHARSIDSMHLFARHPSRSYVKALHESIKHKIPPNIRICGENMWATHSIHYNDLPAYFLVFDIFAESNGLSYCLCWDATKKICEELGLHTVPELYRGVYDEKILKSLWHIPSKCGAPEAEGFVVRNANTYREADFGFNNAKWVRANHVQTDEHWMSRKVVVNELRKDNNAKY